MANYKQFTVPLRTLKIELAELYDPKSKSYSDKFVNALDLLATLLEEALKKDKPKDYIYSVLGLRKLYSLQDAIKPYFDINFNLTELTYEIRSDFKIADEKMYLAIIKCKTFVENMPDNSDDKIADLKHGINTFFKDFFDIKLARYELNKKFEVLFAKIKEDNEYFKKEYNKIEQMFSDNADVTLIENAVTSFVQEQKTTQDNNITEHSVLFRKYADLYHDEEQDHLNDKKHNIEEHSSVLFLQGIARLKQELLERSDELSSFEETKEGDPNDQQAPSSSLNISPLEFATAELNNAKQEYSEIERELKGINDLISSYNKEVEQFSTFDHEQLASKKQQLTMITKERDEVATEYGRIMSSDPKNANDVCLRLGNRLSALIEKQAALTSENKNAIELLQVLESVLGIINERKDKNFFELGFERIISIDKNKFSQMNSSSIPPIAGGIKSFFEKMSKRDKSIWYTAGQLSVKSPEMASSLMDLKNSLVEGIAQIKQSLSDSNSEVQAVKEDLQLEYTLHLNSNVISLSDHDRQLMRLQSEYEPLKEKADHNKSIKQELYTLNVNKLGSIVRLENKGKMISKCEKKIVDIKTQELERRQSITDFLQVLTQLVREIDEDDSLDQDKRKSLLGQIAHKISYYQHHQDLLKKRPYDSKDVSDDIELIDGFMSTLKSNFKENVLAPSHSIFGKNRKQKATEIEGLIKKADQWLKSENGLLDSKLIPSYKDIIDDLSKYENIELYKDRINLKKKDIEIRIFQLQYFGSEGFFEKYAHSIRGCASALLGMIYTCLASVFFCCFDYKTDIMFLDDLKSTKQQNKIDEKITSRVKNYPDSALSNILEQYQKGLEQLKQEREALNKAPKEGGLGLSRA